MMAKVPNTITQRNKDLHAQQRRLLAHGFSDAALRAYEEPLHTHISNFCDHLLQDQQKNLGPDHATSEEIWSDAKNMAEWCE